MGLKLGAGPAPALGTGLLWARRTAVLGPTPAGSRPASQLSLSWGRAAAYMCWYLGVCKGWNDPDARYCGCPGPPQQVA